MEMMLIIKIKKKQVEKIAVGCLVPFNFVVFLQRQLFCYMAVRIIYSLPYNNKV